MGTRQVLCDADSQEPKTVDLQEGCVSKINNQRLGFADVEQQVLL